MSLFPLREVDHYLTKLTVTSSGVVAKDRRSE
jgi:hypothetical protein